MVRNSDRDSDRDSSSHLPKQSTRQRQRQLERQGKQGRGIETRWNTGRGRQTRRKAFSAAITMVREDVEMFIERVREIPRQGSPARTGAILLSIQPRLCNYAAECLNALLLFIILCSHRTTMCTSGVKTARSMRFSSPTTSQRKTACVRIRIRVRVRVSVRGSSHCQTHSCDSPAAHRDRVSQLHFFFRPCSLRGSRRNLL